MEKLSPRTEVLEQWGEELKRRVAEMDQLASQADEGGRSAAASDTWAFEVLPSGSELWLPVHAVGIVHMGLLIGEIFDLEALAQDCVGDGVYEFFFSAPPLPFTGAVGSPINPLAVK